MRADPAWRSRRCCRTLTHLSRGAAKRSPTKPTRPQRDSRVCLKAEAATMSKLMQDTGKRCPGERVQLVALARGLGEVGARSGIAHDSSIRLRASSDPLAAVSSGPDRVYSRDQPRSMQSRRVTVACPPSQTASSKRATSPGVCQTHFARAGAAAPKSGSCCLGLGRSATRKFVRGLFGARCLASVDLEPIGAIA